MIETDGGYKPTIEKDSKIRDFDPFDRTSFGDSDFKAYYNSSKDSSTVLRLFGSLEIDREQQDGLDQTDPSDVAIDISHKIMKEIKDACNLSQAASGVAKEKILEKTQDKILNQIRDLSKDSDFDFEQFYHSFEMSLTVNGDHAAPSALLSVDGGNKITNELAHAYLERLKSDKSVDIFKTVNERVAEILKLAKDSTDPTRYESIATGIETDLSALTTAEQYVYNFELSYQVQTHSELTFLNDGRYRVFTEMYFGDFYAQPSDQDLQMSALRDDQLPVLSLDRNPDSDLNYAIKLLQQLQK